MTRRRKDVPKTCSWCGVRLRGRRSCPRGRACANDQKNHDELTARIEGTRGGKRMSEAGRKDANKGGDRTPRSANARNLTDKELEPSYVDGDNAPKGGNLGK